MAESNLPQALEHYSPKALVTPSEYPSPKPQKKKSQCATASSKPLDYAKPWWNMLPVPLAVELCLT